MRKHIKGESQLTKLSESIDFICAKFGEYECKRREKDNVISDNENWCIDNEWKNKEVIGKSWQARAMLALQLPIMTRKIKRLTIKSC